MSRNYISQISDRAHLITHAPRWLIAAIGWTAVVASAVVTWCVLFVCLCVAPRRTLNRVRATNERTAFRKLVGESKLLFPAGL